MKTGASGAVSKAPCRCSIRGREQPPTGTPFNVLFRWRTAPPTTLQAALGRSKVAITCAMLTQRALRRAERHSTQTIASTRTE